MAAKSIVKNRRVRQVNSCRFPLAPSRRINRCVTPERRKSRWIPRIYRLLVWVALFASLTGNIYQNRRWIRDRIVEQLKPDQPVIQISRQGRESPFAIALAQIKEENSRNCRDNSAEVKSVRELFEQFKQVEFERLRYEFGLLKDQYDLSENSRKNFETGVKEIRGELIRKEVLPKEYSTAF